MTGALLLPPDPRVAPWGRTAPPAPFVAPVGERLGEVWFAPPPPLDHLLAKLLFTSEKLSVQVHPPDHAAPAGERGKDECWLVLAAEPGARLGVGLVDEVEQNALRQAALDGSVEQLLAWHEAQPGDFLYLPAGTIHAIGPGLVLAEIQQASDVTYRFYDYGRGRPLHLDAALGVAIRRPHPAALRRHVAKEADLRLVDGPHFILDHLGSGGAAIAGRALVMVLAGTLVAGNICAAAGQVLMLQDGALAKAGADARLLVVRSAA